VQPSFPPKFKILVAALKTPSDPSRGTAGNPTVTRTGFSLQQITLRNGTSRIAGPVAPFVATSALSYTASIKVVSADYWDAGTLTFASGTLTFAGNAGNGETVTIGAKTYTFQTVLTDVNGNVFIGASASDSLDNLIAAIMLGAGSGVSYAAATTLHPTATAVAGTGDTLVATAKTGGTGGNALVSTSTVTGGTWGAVTLTGGITGAAPPLYTREEIALFDRFVVAGENFGAGLGSGAGPVATIATQLAAALKRFPGIDAVAVTDTVYIKSNRPDGSLPIKATNDLSTVLGTSFEVYSPGAVLLSVGPEFRQTFFIVRTETKFQSPPVSLP